MQINEHILLELLVLALAIGVPFVVIRMARLKRLLRQRYAERGRQLAQALHMVRLSEDLGQLGNWHLDKVGGTQEWSPGLFRLFGMEGGGDLCPGDAEMLFADGGRELDRRINENEGNRDPFAFDFGATRVDGRACIFRMHARNKVENGTGKRSVYGVVMDVTEQRQRESALLRSEQEARDRADEARKLAETDPLTGLANRRFVMDWIDRAIVRHKTGGTGVNLIMFDIDHFKAVNDRFGHQNGDAVLCRVAEIARQQARSQDLVGRIGGEEFVLGIAGSDITIARVMAERLRVAIARESGIPGVGPVTVSMGFAASRPGDSSLALFARADAALYDAKHAGRNRVRLAA